MFTVRRFILALIAGAAVAMTAAPASVAAPDCSDAGPTVTFCQTKGSTQLTTTPPPWNYGGWTGISVWPLVGAFGLGP
ncbi:hypothetical protein ACAG25_18820 [Mycobacterium sp. pV006]|uniref:hypothetical protein n=1 Tax=Mycobacterium sp. pV006 TaxID=3238983 RepID=UPI00351B237D